MPLKSQWFSLSFLLFFVFRIIVSTFFFVTRDTIRTNSFNYENIENLKFERSFCCSLNLLFERLVLFLACFLFLNSSNKQFLKTVITRPKSSNPNLFKSCHVLSMISSFYSLKSVFLINKYVLMLKKIVYLKIH